ncbi:MAG: hypothetical protein V1827_01545 [Candidatus Micrarchaeota archaeon]
MVHINKCRPRKASLKLRNAKTEFDNCRSALEDGIVYARLGLDRDKTAKLDYVSEVAEVSAFVRKGKRREHCQDAAFVFIKGPEVTAGVFDGYMANGTYVSETIADLLVGLCSRGCPLPFEEAGKRIGSLRHPPDISGHGGSTAVFANVVEDGGFYVNGISDSAAYRIKKKEIERMFRYESDCNGNPLRGTDAEFFFRQRSYVRHTVTVYGIEQEHVESDGGLLNRGDSLLLVSDGVTKNLTVRVDPETMKIEDSSGAGDLARILRGASSATQMVSAVLKAIDRRIASHKIGARFRRCNKDTVILPEDDDVTIVAIKRNQPGLFER